MLYKETKVDIGNIKLGQSDVEVRWEFDELTKDDIAFYNGGAGDEIPAIQAFCGCTASFDIDDNGITALYTDNGSKTGVVTKSIYVYYKPEEDIPVRVTNEKGVETFNPKLAKTQLSFSMNVGK